MTPAIREIHHYKKENGGPTELAERQPEGVLGSCLGLRASRKPSEMEPLRRGLQPGLGESGARAGSARRGPGSRSCTGRGSRQPQEVTANRRGDPGAAGRRGCQCGGYRAAQPLGPRTAPSDRGLCPSGAGRGAHPPVLCPGFGGVVSRDPGGARRARMELARAGSRSRVPPCKTPAARPVPGLGAGRARVGGRGELEAGGGDWPGFPSDSDRPAGCWGAHPFSLLCRRRCVRGLGLCLTALVIPISEPRHPVFGFAV